MRTRMRSRRPRIRGPKPHPLGRITPSFAQAVATSGQGRGTLSAVAGFTSLSRFSPLFYDVFPLTPIVVGRLETLAAMLHFRGNVVETAR